MKRIVFFLIITVANSVFASDLDKVVYVTWKNEDGRYGPLKVIKKVELSKYLNKKDLKYYRHVLDSSQISKESSPLPEVKLSAEVSFNAEEDSRSVISLRAVTVRGRSAVPRVAFGEEFLTIDRADEKIHLDFIQQIDLHPNFDKNK